jgi:predicted phage terminase large subunit-like protein
MGLSPEIIELWEHLERLDGAESILANVPLLTPRYSRPDHLRPVAEVLYRGETQGGVRACISCPPRHGKTELLMHFVPWYLRRHPENNIALLMHTARLAERKSGQIRQLAQRGGLNLRTDSKAKTTWLLKEGGGLDALGGGATPIGLGFQWIIVDDPIRNREDAESPTIREKVHEWIKADVMSRLEPGGNILVMHQRWTDDDPIGRLISQTDEDGITWEYLNLPAWTEHPATCTCGQCIELAQRRLLSLWPERWPVDALDMRRREVGEYNWASMYLGEPVPKGGRLFGEPGRYVAADLQGARIAIACDPAASEDNARDHSSIAVVAAKGLGVEERAYVLDIWRGRVTVPVLVQQLIMMQRRWNCPIHVEAVGGFKAVPQMLRQIDPQLRVVEISGNIGSKFTRAQACAAAWNDGRVFVPMDIKPWLDPFLREVQAFTGISDKEDDQVDALCHAYNAVHKRSPGIIRGPQKLLV